MSAPEILCPKCGGKMAKGELQTSAIQSSQFIYPFNIGSIGVVSPTTYESSEKLFWVETTGEKKGLLIKREETKRLTLSGLRCKVCGYIELYAKET